MRRTGRTCERTAATPRLTAQRFDVTALQCLLTALRSRVTGEETDVTTTRSMVSVVQSARLVGQWGVPTPGSVKFSPVCDVNTETGVCHCPRKAEAGDHSAGTAPVMRVAAATSLRAAVGKRWA